MLKQIMYQIEVYRMSGGREEHFARKEAIKNRLEELIADAERYRWLRKAEADASSDLGIVRFDNVGNIVALADDLDEYIDQQLKAAV